MPDVVVTGEPLTPADVLAVARGGAGVRLAAEALANLAAGREIVERLASGDRPAYGISTGFGALATRHIPAESRAQLQRSLVRSHAAGMGPAVEPEVVRAMMLLRLRTLATGRTGVRPVVAETLARLIASGVTPAVPEHGSLGCSGDLAPLAAVALALMGEGDAGVADPVVLEEKEGLALINGTDGMLAMLLLACADLASLLTHLDVAAAMSVEALLGTDRVFAADLQALRPHPGQAASAANLRNLLAGSAIVASHREGDTRVQDAYSLRCAPQVHGAARDTLAHAAAVAERELAATIDNPVVLPDGRVESNGNFHGAPVGYVCDFLAVAIADVGSMAERRTDRMLDKGRSHGLPPFLADDPGVDSGLMIAHYTQAGMVAENRRLAVPASADNVPTSGMQEDHNSLGWGAARKLRQAVHNLRRIVAVELVTAARALDLRAPLAPAAGTAAARDAIRAAVPGPGPDRWLAPELAAAEDLVEDGAILRAVAAAGVEVA
ncbi:MAG TPA: histidine ammonia-lyase [Frankiaceae bacterium]|nr:histidine ammonia-lyase [Frankiaceae bacterium]